MEDNLLELYKSQSQIEESDLYKKYENDMSKFFKLSSDSDEFTKVLGEDDYILKSKTNKQNKIVIKPPKIVNLYKLKVDLINRKNKILEKINYLINQITLNANSQEFDILKKDYIKINKNLNELFSIENIQKEELDKLVISNDIILQLTKLFFDRKDLFKKINKNISLEKKKNIIKKYKLDEGIVNSNEDIKSFSSNIGIEQEECKNWLKWIDTCVKYIKLQNEINKKINLIQEKQKELIEEKESFILKRPVVDEHKNLNVEITNNKKKLVGGHNNSINLIKN